MERFIYCNQVLRTLLLFYFFYYSGFQVNYLSSFSSSSPNTSTNYLCPPNQSLALLQFKSIIEIHPWRFCFDNSSVKTDSWKEDSDCCSWDGVTCNEITGNVIGLDLHCWGLQGTIEDDNTLFQLTHLQWINLAYNNFSGSKISPEFGRLMELTQLNLSYSDFDGLVPSEISLLSKLNLLDISSYDLSMNQQNFDLLALNLTRLSVLKLSSMDMSSVKPYSLLNLSLSMMVLDLSWTSIQGKFPEEIFSLPNLEEVDLSYNENLTGYLPKSNWSSHLRVLDLTQINFTGDIPNSIGNLKFLEILSINWCNFIGSIPISIGNLTRVTKLYLSGNKLTGQIPKIFNKFSLSPLHSPQLSYHGNILSHLTQIDLSENFLDGKIPSWLFTRPSLESIDLSSNNLIGPIEEFNLSLATSLVQVFLSENEINGSIPNSIFELVNLTYLDISSNNLRGTIKFDMLSKLKNLETLDLSNNSLLLLSPTTSMNYSLPNLEYLDFAFCNLSEFPMFLRTFEKLESLYLSNNRISGQILKTESEGWKSLTKLYLSNNFLTYIEHHTWKNIQILGLQNNTIQGSILVPPLSTQVFLLSNNKLSGDIPPSICVLISLQYLSLSENNLNGIIPPCLGNLSTSLVILHLQNNNLEGRIPYTFTNGSQLRSLDLRSNKLEGQLPRSLANCSLLKVFNVGNNMISDTFPCWLGTLLELKVLILRSNRFYGPICDSQSSSLFNNLQIIDISHNKFIGFLPRRFFAYMEKMMGANKDEFEGQQYVRGTEYYEVTKVTMKEGEILSTTYYFDSVNVTMKGGEYILNKIFTFFTSIDLSRNQFQGEIPEILGKCQSLVVLNLSHNSLTGNIPMSFTNLTALESLDLSFNKLDGKISNQLLSITTLSALNLSYNQLSGPIPQGNQFNTFENDSFIGNEGLCGKPLSMQCNNEPPLSLVLNEEDEITSEFDWKFAMTGYASGVVIGISIGHMVFSTEKPKWFVRIVEERLIEKVRRSNKRQGRRNK